MGLFGFFKKKQQAPAHAFKERRNLPRWKISANATIKWVGQEDYVDCSIKDLNLKGFAVIITKDIPQNCGSVDINFHERFFFNVEISIIWHKQAEGKHIYGVKFTRLRDSDKEKIYQMMCLDFPQHMQR